MTKQEKQLLLIDLCARLPYGVKVQVCNVTEYTPILKGILGDDLFLQFDYITKPIKNGDSTYNLIEDNIKPYLRPMSSMTEKENTEMNLIIYSTRVTGEYFRITEYYNKNHLDYYDLIGRNLALEAPKGMYK